MAADQELSQRLRHADAGEQADLFARTESEQANRSGEQVATGWAQRDTLYAVHLRMRGLYESAELRTRAGRLGFVSEVVGRPITWGHELTPAECRAVIAALEAGISEPKEESPWP